MRQSSGHESGLCNCIDECSSPQATKVAFVTEAEGFSPSAPDGAILPTSPQRHIHPRTRHSFPIFHTVPK